MNRYQFSFLNKAQAAHVLPELFDILYYNMSKITPAEKDCEADRAEWLEAVLPAIQKAPRQILLMHEGDMLAGYLQYYVNNGVFMVEEIQLKPAYQRTLLLHRLCRFLATVIPADTGYIEAFAHPKNVISQAIQRSLGMELVGTEENGTLHFRGNCQILFDRFLK
ncbi:MAG: hypothetical protein J6D21_12305 [Clostridia bacterium]|nr:hypothetical protein [Clostridia bacterium]